MNEEFQLTPPNITPAGEDPAFVEQGLRVYMVNDMEWWVGTDRESVIAACLAAWGGSMPDAMSEYFPDGADDVGSVNLDTNRVNLNEDCLPEGPFVTYREYIRQMLAEGAPIPSFFCGVDY